MFAVSTSDLLVWSIRVWCIKLLPLYRMFKINFTYPSNCHPVLFTDFERCCFHSFMAVETVLNNCGWMHTWKLKKYIDCVTPQALQRQSFVAGIKHSAVRGGCNSSSVWIWDNVTVQWIMEAKIALHPVLRSEKYVFLYLALLCNSAEFNTKGYLRGLKCHRQSIHFLLMAWRRKLAREQLCCCPTANRGRFIAMFNLNTCIDKYSHAR